ncbi:MAG: hypothetical protein H6673_04060 [Anaerolineales bacterium]|nr:hypothetical protein [Anaerolineales bacterium]
MGQLDALLQVDGSEFLAAVIVGPQQTILGSYAQVGLDTTTAQAPLVTTQRIFSSPESLTALAEMQESVFYDLDGRRLVCRPIIVRGKIYVLIVLTSAESTYRRTLNKLVKAIEKTL